MPAVDQLGHCNFASGYNYEHDVDHKKCSLNTEGGMNDLLFGEAGSLEHNRIGYSQKNFVGRENT